MFTGVLTVAVLAAVILAGPIQDPEESLDLFEGDIELPPSTGFRSAIGDKKKLWPDGVVPYEIDDPKSLITEAQRANLTEAMDTIADKTCVRFKLNEDPELKTFLRIQKSKSGCSSNVGMMSSSRLTASRGQSVRLSDRCFEIGKITHELMHSLGFFHEQSRHDRDQYVTIIPQNVEQGKLRQFRLYDVSKTNMELNAPYDYGSLMHYTSSAFAVRTDALSIVPIYEAEIGQRRAMSNLDIWKINKQYNCPNTGPVPRVDRKPKAEVDDKLLFPVERSFDCTFEYHYACGLRDELNNEFDWKIGKGRTTKYSETGPKHAANGEACCYIYMDTIFGTVGSQGSLVTPAMQPTQDEGSCLSFYYHMYGKTVGSLEVFWRTLGTNEENMLLQKSGNQGEQWIKKHFVLNIKTDFEIVFRGTVGGDDSGSYEGNIALDNIVVVPMFRLAYRGKKCGQ